MLSIIVSACAHPTHFKISDSACVVNEANTVMR